MKILFKITKILTFLLITTNLTGQNTGSGKVIVLINQGKFKEAEYILVNESLNLNNEKKVELLGDVYGYQKEWEKSKIQYKKLIEINPDNANYHFKYGSVLGMLALENKIKGVVLVDDIKDAFTKAAELDPSHVEVRWALLELYIQLPGIIGGSFNKAEKYADELGEILKIEGFLAKGYIADYRGRDKETEIYFKKALELIGTVNENHPRHNINYQIGKIAARYNIYLDSGIMHLNRYVQNYSASDNVSLNWIFLHLARIYMHKKDKENALINIDKALLIRPNFKWALQIKQEIEAM